MTCPPPARSCLAMAGGSCAAQARRAGRICHSCRGIIQAKSGLWALLWCSFLIKNRPKSLRNKVLATDAPRYSRSSLQGRRRRAQPCAKSLTGPMTMEEVGDLSSDFKRTNERVSQLSQQCPLLWRPIQGRNWKTKGCPQVQPRRSTVDNKQYSSSLYE